MSLRSLWLLRPSSLRGILCRSRIHSDRKDPSTTPIRFRAYRKAPTHSAAFCPPHAGRLRNSLHTKRCRQALRNGSQDSRLCTRIAIPLPWEGGIRPPPCHKRRTRRHPLPNNIRLGLRSEITYYKRKSLHAMIYSRLGTPSNHRIRTSLAELRSITPSLQGPKQAEKQALPPSTMTLYGRPLIELRLLVCSTSKSLLDQTQVPATIFLPYSLLNYSICLNVRSPLVHWARKRNHGPYCIRK